MATIGHPSPSVLDSGHSIWSDDGISTRRIPVPGGIDSRFNNIDLGHPPTPATARTPSRPFSVSVTRPNNNGVEIIWDAHHDSDAESQYSADTIMDPPEGKVARFPKVFGMPFTLTFWQRLKGEGRVRIGWGASFKAYIGSRIYLHNPPGDNDNLHEHPNAPASFKADIANMEEEEPAVNPWVCILVLLVTVVLLGFTSEFVRDLLHDSQIGKQRETHEDQGNPPARVRFINAFPLDFIKQVTDSSASFSFPWCRIPRTAFSQQFTSVVDTFGASAATHLPLLLNWLKDVWFYPGQTDIQHMQTCETVAQSLTEPTKNVLLKVPQANMTSPSREANTLNATAMQLLSDRLQRVIDLHNVVSKDHVGV
ncbi:hypothetical protein H0H87_011782 [Tephrocybe sp. NHM501043]|nr:hypothetical protein H0H87_011782 [Tephrocybe sp. NHM501043]